MAERKAYDLMEESTSFVDAGAVQFGIEYLTLNPAIMMDLHPKELEDMKQIMEASGVDLDTLDISAIFFHVLDADRNQYIRLDCPLGDLDHINHPEAKWHWHYTPPGSDFDSAPDEILTYMYDKGTHGPDLWDWWFTCLETRLPDMLRCAGAGDLAHTVSQEAVRQALPRTRALVREAEKDFALTSS